MLVEIQKHLDKIKKHCNKMADDIYETMEADSQDAYDILDEVAEIEKLLQGDKND